jgi:hypothetical protein
MKWNLADRSTRLRAISFIVLGLGLLLAVAIYRSAAQNPEQEPEWLSPDYSKQTLRQAEVYGGKANVLATEFRQWFSGLWHGRSLAFTVFVLSALVAAGFRLAAIPLPPMPPVSPEPEIDSNRDGPVI